MLLVLAGATVLLSIRPALNLVSSDQVMNASHNPLHLVNSYGMFGTITRERFEIVVEGTDDPRPAASTTWREYEFKGKPGDVTRRPPQVAPYHLRLDWVMWFLPFSVTVTPGGPFVRRHELWFGRLLERLLQADAATLALLRTDPFGGRPPAYVRALFYRYRFTSPAEKAATGAWWKRELLGEYFPAVDLGDLRAILPR